MAIAPAFLAALDLAGSAMIAIARDHGSTVEYDIVLRPGPDGWKARLRHTTPSGEDTGGFAPSAHALAALNAAVESVRLAWVAETSGAPDLRFLRALNYRFVILLNARQRKENDPEAAEDVAADGQTSGNWRFSWILSSKQAIRESGLEGHSTGHDIETHIQGRTRNRNTEPSIPTGFQEIARLSESFGIDQRLDRERVFDVTLRLPKSSYTTVSVRAVDEIDAVPLGLLGHWLGSTSRRVFGARLGGPGSARVVDVVEIHPVPTAHDELQAALDAALARGCR